MDYVYDAAGRLSQQALPGNRTITYTYDPATKNLSSLAGPDAESLSFTYDGSFLLSETWSGTINGTVSRTHDNDPSTVLRTGFRVTSRSVNGANTASFGYDVDSLLPRTASDSATISSPKRCAVASYATRPARMAAAEVPPVDSMMRIAARVTGSRLGA